VFFFSLSSVNRGPRSPLNTDDLDDDGDDDDNDDNDDNNDAGVLTTFASAGCLAEIKNIFSLISDGRKETNAGYLAIVSDSIVFPPLCFSRPCYC